jgi:hypothetical protein
MHQGHAQTLASYFGDDEAVPGGLCGKCTFCTTLEAVQFETRITSAPDENRVHAILAACPERDDPRMLARMAFGITSPRLTAGKYSSHSLFGSMVDTDFNMLVAAFDTECEKVGYKKNQNSMAPVTGKRTHPASSFSGQGSSRSKYSQNKRGRY